MNFEPRMGRIDTDKKMAEKRRAVLGQAKLALCFQIPSHASLHGILKAQRSLCCANGPGLRLAQKSLGENTGLRLASKRGCVVKNICKPACECLFRNTSSIRTANQPRVFYLPIRVYLGNQWLKVTSCWQV
jgi:hypothetical protein